MLMTPLELNNNLRRICEAIRTNTPTAFDSLRDLEDTKLDSNKFAPEVIDEIQEKTCLAAVLLMCDFGQASIEVIKNVRRLLWPDVSRELLFVNRFLKPDTDIGILSALPDLALYEVQQIVHAHVVA